MAVVLICTAEHIYVTARHTQDVKLSVILWPQRGFSDTSNLLPSGFHLKQVRSLNLLSRGAWVVKIEIRSSSTELSAMRVRHLVLMRGDESP